MLMKSWVRCPGSSRHLQPTTGREVSLHTSQNKSDAVNTFCLSAFLRAVLGGQAEQGDIPFGVLCHLPGHCPKGDMELRVSDSKPDLKQKANRRHGTEAVEITVARTRAGCCPQRDSSAVLFLSSC